MEKKYTEIVADLFKVIEKKNSKTVDAVSKLLKKTIDQGGVLYVFGSGHSSMLAEEAFHRAGGLIPVNPILLDAITPHVSPKIAGPLERLSGIAVILLDRSGITSKDLLFIASQSGINSAAIEMAMACEKRKIPTVAFTSVEHSKSTASRHVSGKKLYQLCLHVLDNSCPIGDGLVEMGGTRVAAGSTLANGFLYGWVLSTLCKLWSKEGKTLPIYKSANLPDSEKHNVNMEKKYKTRIPLL